jgi:hypothetical protein
MCVQEHNSSGFLIPGENSHVELEVAKACKMFGSDLTKEGLA